MQEQWWSSVRQLWWGNCGNAIIMMYDWTWNHSICSKVLAPEFEAPKCCNDLRNDHLVKAMPVGTFQMRCRGLRKSYPIWSLPVVLFGSCTSCKVEMVQKTWPFPDCGHTLGECGWSCCASVVTEAVSQIKLCRWECLKSCRGGNFSNSPSWCLGFSGLSISNCWAG